MRRQSPEYCGRRRKERLAAIQRAGLVLTLTGLGIAGGWSHARAQGTQADVAHVEAVSGRVVASARDKPVLLDVLDLISGQTRLDLQASSELRLCHHQTRKLVTLRGPLRAWVSAGGVAAQDGTPAGASIATCAAPVVSTFQGGIVSRNIAVTTTPVPLRPSIKIVNRGSKPIRKIALWDGMRQKMIATFDRNFARPVLDDGQSYLVVVELIDGGQMTLMLQANGVAESGPLFLVVR